MDSRSGRAPALIGTGVVLQSVGLTLLVLAALAALGLDRSGYPVVSALGHPAWIIVAALLSVCGGIITGYGAYALTRSIAGPATDASKPVPA